MAFFKRITLFLMVNILVVTTITVLLNVLGVQPHLTAQGIDYESLAVFCLVWGMGGAFISLLISKKMAKWMMGVQIVTAATPDAELRWLVQTVERLSVTAGLSKAPEVGVYSSGDLNAFATGPTRSNSLVAVSSGLLQRMSKEEIEGVLGHEISHIANGDMVTMTLLQGVVNAFVMFLARVVAFALTTAGKSDDRRSSFGSYYMVQFLLQTVFMILGSMVVAAFSRYREFRADQGSAGVVGNGKMIKALQALQRAYDRPIHQEVEAKPAIQALMISGGSRMMRLFSTHPPLEERIQRLQNSSY